MNKTELIEAMAAKCELSKKDTEKALKALNEETLKDINHFKEISPNSVNVKDLPAGCVIVFDRGMHEYSDKYGHVEITTGDGRGVSDGVTTNLQKPSAIFMPV